jgi:hypothetical protein
MTRTLLLALIGTALVMPAAMADTSKRRPTYSKTLTFTLPTTTPGKPGKRIKAEGQQNKSYGGGGSTGKVQFQDLHFTKKGPRSLRARSRQ